MTVATWFLMMAYIMRQQAPVSADCYGTYLGSVQAIHDEPRGIWELLDGECPFDVVTE